ncbi:MAG TPA: LuxR C-terminal-related transcriptional regulator [Actinophytocola sp.]|uniref:helix-turn-helix domain-containing protein n=1 Tax=Actinophytocola sp. TaxID=1872138 RepID=UPI002DB97B54|nr:LuxR C-terminal-related transcriptional regulator [Actinophytocola sp.]HEU5475066.1 LuxR C-terminal-related transcriptional regulator [Actinophytocola sp.]
MELYGLGVTPAEQRLYEVLLRHSDRTLAELTELTPLGRPRLRTLLKSLADKGLLSTTGHRPARFAAAPPDLAVELLTLRRQQEIEQARLAGTAFCNRVGQPGRTGAESPVEVVLGRAAVGQRFRQIQQVTRGELLILDKPPYVVDPDGDQYELQRRLLDGGVRYRTIYDHDALGPAGRIEQLRQLAASGEQARVLTGVPMKLVIADRRLGLAPHDAGHTETAVLIRASALLDGLVTLFETLWEQATPLWPQRRWPPAGDPLSNRDQQLLALLAAGLTDQAIARRLGVALRTVERRVRHLMDGLGARTRFQAGLRAAVRGRPALDTGDEKVAGCGPMPSR